MELCSQPQRLTLGGINASRMSVRMIINPTSGNGRRQRALETLARLAAERLGANLKVVYSDHSGHPRELAREAVAEGVDRVIAAGGDGTVNEVGQELINTHVALGILPCGSGNGLARHLGIPSSPRKAIRLAIAGKKFAMDTGTANGLPFLNVMGIGFDAEISAQFNQLERRGSWPYFRVGWHTFRRWKPFSFTLSHGPSISGHAWLITVANASQYGNNAFIAPEAAIADGDLDCVILRPASLAETASLGIRLFCRNLHRHPAVQTLRNDRFRITRESEGWIHTDGESHWTGTVIDITTHPKSLNVVANRPLWSQTPP